MKQLLIALLLLCACPMAHAQKYLGNFAAGATVPFSFNTHDAGGAPITLVGGSVIVYRVGSTTESTAGVTLDDDYDGFTGSHDGVITTVSDGTFYAAGNDYKIKIATGTVSGVSVAGTTVATFSIDNRLTKLSVGTGTGQLNLATGAVPIQVGTGTGQVNLVSGLVPVQVGTGAGQINLTAGNVTVGTNNDKANYTVSDVTNDAKQEISSQVRTDLEGLGTPLTNINTLVNANLDAAVSEAVEAAEDAGAGARDTRDLDDVDHLWELRRSGDGSWRSINKLIVHPGDTWRAGWNCNTRGILPSGKKIAEQGDPELVTASDDLTLTDPPIGHDGTVSKVEFEVEQDAVPGTTHWIKTPVTATEASGPKWVYGEVEVQAEPE